MEGKSVEAVVKKYKGLQAHLNPRNSIFSKVMGKSKDVFKWAE